MEEQPADYEESADDNRAEDCFPWISIQKRQPPAGDNLVQVTIAIEDYRVCPSLARPEPNPAWPAISPIKSERSTSKSNRDLQIAIFSV